MSLLRAVLVWCLTSVVRGKIVTFISDSREARENKGVIVTKFTFHGTQAKSKLRSNNTIGGLYFFPREKLLMTRDVSECNQFLRKASFSLFPPKTDTQFKERIFPLWTKEAQTFYAVYVDAATCYPQYPLQKNVALELHLLNDGNVGGHLSAEEDGLKAVHLLLSVVYVIGALWFGFSLYQILIKAPTVMLVLKLFFVAAGSQALVMILPAFHWTTYESNGWGVPFFQSVASLSHLISNIAMSALTTDVIIGWTLGSTRRMSTPRSEKVLRAVVLCNVCYTFLHFYLQGLDVNDPLYYTLSSNRELFMGLLWVVQCGVYLGVLAGTYQDDRSALRQDFYSTFAWIIISWNMAYPASQFIVLLMAEYNRAKVFIGISNFLRMISLGQLTVLFIKRSVFWEVSSLAGSSSLPFAEKSFGATSPPVSDRSPTQTMGGNNFANFYNSDSKVTKRH